jgi:hypothetical protein
MSDKKISELTALTAPDGAEELVVNDSGTSKKITQANLLKGIDNSSADATAITIDASENVGIGTSSPDANLDVKDSSGGVIRVGTDTDNIGTDTAFGTLEFFNGDTSNSGPAVTAMIEAKTHPTNAYSTGGDIVFSNRSYPSSSLIEKVRFPSDGGITFNGDTAAANALDDYEEGTWTPGISFGGGVVGLTYTIQVGYYTKVGNLVTATCRIFLSAKGTSTGSSAVTGLPFTSSSTTNSYSMPSLRLASITFADAFQGYNGPNGTLVTLKEVTNAGADTPLTDANFTDTSTVMMTLTYRV